VNSDGRIEVFLVPKTDVSSMFLGGLPHLKDLDRLIREGSCSSAVLTTLCSRDFSSTGRYVLPRIIPPSKNLGLGSATTD
jgi:hypothetical protein